jgi:chemotaxis protein CheD
MTNEVMVRVADLRAAPADTVLVTVGLGSCVAVALHDPEARVGGLAHVLLPSPALSRSEENPAKFPQTAVPRLLELMVGLGAVRRRITARLAGGASMFGNISPAGTIQMGERNVVACRQVLEQLGVPLLGEAVGGDYGRTVRLDVSSGRVEVSSIRHGAEQI